MNGRMDAWTVTWINSFGSMLMMEPQTKEDVKEMLKELEEQGQNMDYVSVFAPNTNLTFQELEDYNENKDNIDVKAISTLWNMWDSDIGATDEDLIKLKVLASELVSTVSEAIRNRDTISFVNVDIDNLASAIKKRLDTLMYLLRLKMIGYQRLEEGKYLMLPSNKLIEVVPVHVSDSGSSYVSLMFADNGYNSGEEDADILVKIYNHEEIMEKINSFVQEVIRRMKDASKPRKDVETYNVYFYFGLSLGQRPSLGMKADRIEKVVVPKGSSKNDVILEGLKKVGTYPRSYYADIMKIK
jgi:hypothetical protein